MTVAATQYADSVAQVDHLGDAVLRSLGQPLRQKNAWGLIRTLVMAGLTCGLWPLITWPLKFREFVRTEQVQLEHLARWAKLQYPSVAADDLSAQVKKMSHAGGLSAVAIISAMVLIVLAISDWDIIFRGGYTAWMGQVAILRGPVPVAVKSVAMVWVGILSVGYLCHALAIRSRAGEMQRVIERLNRLARQEGLIEVEPPTLGAGIGLGGLIVGIGLTVLGMWWAMPLVLAGSFQRRYTLVTSREARNSIAHRLVALLQVRRPGGRVQVPVSLQRRCVRELCRCPLPDSAKFCPRCGAPVPPAN